MTSSTILSPSVRFPEEEFTSIYCIDGIKPRMSPSVIKNAQNPVKSICQPLHGTSCLGGVFLRKEPLKIGLYSDDSSIGSCDSETDDDFDDDISHFPKRMRRPNNFGHNQCLVSGNTPLTHLPQNIVSSSSESVSSSSTGSTYPPCISSVSSLNREPSSISCKRKRTRQKRSVSLDKSVSVIPIPSRAEYSGRVRERIWSTSEELFANAARNSVEFASEGWNWRQAVEDEGMLVHKPTGELIHPIHLQNALACIHQEEKGDKPVITTNRN